MSKAYKYRANTELLEDKSKRDVVSLANNVIYAANIQKLNDPFEGSVELLEYEESKHWNIIQKLYGAGIYSLSKPKNDETFPCNELLWAHYANSHKGFCIEYDLDKLSKHTLSNYDISHVLHVSYENERPKVSANDSVIQTQKEVLAKKSLAWEYENEVRLVFEKYGKKVIPEDAVTAIYFGLRIDLEDRCEIIKRMSGHNIEFYQIEHVGNLYQLKATKLLFDYSYEIISAEHKPTVNNYTILYKSSNKDRNSINEFFKQIKQHLKYPMKITLVDGIQEKPFGYFVTL